MLSDSDSDAEADNQQDVHQLTINEHYAKAFEYKKEREELQRRAFLRPAQVAIIYFLQKYL
jgi:protein KRI1